MSDEIRGRWKSLLLPHQKALVEEWASRWEQAQNPCAEMIATRPFPDTMTRIASRVLKKPYALVTPSERMSMKNKFWALMYTNDWGQSLRRIFGDDITSDDWKDHDAG